MAEEKASKSRYVFLLLRIAVVIGTIIWGSVWISRDVGWSNLGDTFLAINLWILLGCLGIFALGQIIIGLRWWLLLRSQGIFISLAAAVKLHFLGLFYNNFMPSSVGGDLIRAGYVTKHTDKRLEAALSVFVDRAIGLLSTLVIASFFYLLFIRGKVSVINSADAEQSSSLLGKVAQYSSILIWAIVIVGVVVFVMLLSKHGRLALSKIRASVCTHSIRAANKISNAVIIYCRSPLTILGVFGLTVFMQLMVITGFWFLGVNLGIEAGLKYYYVCFTLTWVIGAVPVSIGGAGVVEGSLIILFIQLAGVGEEAASALALCQRAVWMLTSLPGAVIHLVGAHLPVKGEEAGLSAKEFFIDEDKVTD